jgi:hypothetical protein
METVRMFSHASDVQTGYLLITVAWCSCYSYCQAKRETIAFSDVVTNGGQAKPWVAAVTVCFWLILHYMAATTQAREKSVVVALVGTRIRTKWWKETQECWLLHHNIHLRIFAGMLDPKLMYLDMSALKFQYFCVVLCMVCLCRSVYCLCVNVYCNTATGWLPSCS